MPQMKICDRCKRDIGLVNGPLDWIFHALFGGWCGDCTAQKRRHQEQLQQERELAYERGRAEEQGRLDAREERRRRF